MNESTVVFHHAAPAQSGAFNPLLALSVAYEVRDLFGMEANYLCNAVPLASLVHKGNGWTRVSVTTRDEARLLQYLRDNRSDWRKV